MKKIRIYTTTYCHYCVLAKDLLKAKGLNFEEVDVTNDSAKRAWLVEKTGQRTVPQIFFDEESIGGHSDLVELIRNEKLNAKLVR